MRLNEKFEQLIERAGQLLSRIESILPQPLSAPDWSASTAWRYRKRSSGHGALEPVRHLAAIRLADLKEIDTQKEKIQRNTLQFVHGQPANNVLLTGARGTGKSSLIKACLNEYAGRGLRLIEVDKADMVDLPDIVDVVASRPEKFIVFCDDLSFEEGEPGLQGAQVHPRWLGRRGHAQRADLRDQQPAPPAARVHEGKPELHAHGGRRGASRRGGGREDLAVRAVRTVGELLSVQPGRVPGDRGAMAVLVRRERPAIEAARPEALVWALERGSRSGRVAYQFARDYAGRHPHEAGRRRWSPTATARAKAARSQGSRSRRGRADPRGRRLPADVAAAGQGLRGLLGISGRQGRTGRNAWSRRCGANCTRKSASPSAPSIPGASSGSTIRMRWCG